MSRKKHKCRSTGCHEEPYLGGLCKEHYEEDREKRILTDAAVHALHTGTIDGELPENPELREELANIKKWWFRACDAVNFQRLDPILKDEAEYAVQWCIRLAEQIVVAEIAHRKGNSRNTSFEFTKKWVWDRLKNLESGLMSNGIKRPE